MDVAYTRTFTVGVSHMELLVYLVSMLYAEN